MLGDQALKAKPVAAFTLATTDFQHVELAPKLAQRGACHSDATDAVHQRPAERYARNFAAYSFVLSGYTAAIVGLPT